MKREKKKLSYKLLKYHYSIKIYICCHQIYCGISVFLDTLATSTFKNCTTVMPFLLDGILIRLLNMKMNKQLRVIMVLDMVKGFLFKLYKLFNTKFGQFIECIRFFMPNKMKGSKSKWKKCDFIHQPDL